MYIREFRWPEDYNAVIALWQVVGLHNPTIDGLTELRLLVERNPGLFLLAVDEQAGIIGSVIGAFDGRRAHLYHVAIHPEHRRRGYATLLIKEVEQRIWALGVNKIRFTVGKNNIAAHEFYRSLGFAEDDYAIFMSKSQRNERSARKLTTENTENTEGDGSAKTQRTQRR